MEYIKATCHCVRCNKEVKVSVPVDGWTKFKAGELIQNALPNITPEIREFILTGFCPECQWELYGHEEEKEYEQIWENR